MLTTKMITKKAIYYKEVVQLYEESFPKKERIKMSFLLSRVSKNTADFFAYFDNDIFIGFAYNVHNDKICYVLYLAIVEEFRGLGYGSQILSLIKDANKLVPVVLAIEPIDKKFDNYKIRIKRKQFYLNNGFTDSGFCYHEYQEHYDLLVWNGKVSDKHFNSLMKKYTGLIMYYIIKPILTKK